MKMHRCNIIYIAMLITFASIMINSCEGINGLKKMNINEPPSFMSPESMQPPPTSILDTSAENFYPSPYDERLKADEAVTDGKSFKECPCRRVRRIKRVGWEF